MSAAPLEPDRFEVVEAALEESKSRLLAWFGTVVVLVVRSLIGVLFCFHPLLSILVVGWTFRLMRRRILRGWWRRSPARAALDFDGLAELVGADVPVDGTPRWFVSERPELAIRRPGRDGAPPRLPLMVARWLRTRLGSFGANLRAGLAAVACTYVVTLPGCFLWLASWYDGWNNSFHKGYEQAAVGPLTGLLGVVLFMAAMVYVPMAWAHLAATGDVGAFFQVGLVRRLIGQRLGGSVLLALLCVLLTLPVTFLRVQPYFLLERHPELETAPPEQVRMIVEDQIFQAGFYLFPAFVVLHLASARLYRVAVVGLVERAPGQLAALPHALREVLTTLRLVPETPQPATHPVLGVVVATGRVGLRAVLWVLLFLVWFGVVAQVYVAMFLHNTQAIGWLNQPLVHLPSLFFTPGGSR